MKSIPFPLDLALNKLDSILTRSKARDFIDFYFIQKEHSYKIDPLFLGSCFLKIEKLHDYPKMVKEFSDKEMIAYFINLAKSLKEKIVA
ncbi:hypothetical protein COT64_03550 [Candidatus Shapirobacteria bacterium CG09_land_8_20_14_0_10_39_12]|uniref:Nucleotidyl transferase AbiEii/AbiGii toxin family protein n=1 Tax=Candidatus Shapirobacteria bacterium CG09_land_8_20_14_0_10_39_12 TaxID=1974885 RepID=A0A2H0WQQ3_9BACT|nr:MAG: hypothetical protein COT64_03550 [Candidatus Shapirobacteria bacterium CG09_land_8_20_14_0_10_39_12]